MEVVGERVVGKGGVIVRVVGVVDREVEEVVMVVGIVGWVLVDVVGVLVERMGIVGVGVCVKKLVRFGFGKVEDLGREVRGEGWGVGENDMGGMVVNDGGGLVGFEELDEVDEGEVVEVVGEGSEERGIREVGG